MITVISPPKPSKQVECKQCGATIGYSPIDVKRDFVTDYTGDKEYFSYIPCPCCLSKITVN